MSILKVNDIHNDVGQSYLRPNLMTSKAWNWNGLSNNTFLDFEGIPSWAKRVTILFIGFSTNGTSHKQVQIGAGTITNAGYLSTSSTTSTGIATINATTGFVIYSPTATDVISMEMNLANIAGNSWIGTSVGKISTLNMVYGGGDISLSGTLDRIRVTTVNGTDIIDAGTVNVMYE